MKTKIRKFVFRTKLLNQTQSFHFDLCTLILQILVQYFITNKIYIHVYKISVFTADSSKKQMSAIQRNITVIS